ncbi:MAG: hypothetical protein WA004_07920 [Saprospiraceae bacterium]
MRAVLLVLVFLLSGAFAHVRSGADVAAPVREPVSSGWITAQYPVPAGLHKTGDSLGGNPAEAPSQGGQKDHFPHGAFSLRQLRYYPGWLAGYLNHSPAICIGLSVRQIIFPFHYFW